MSSFVLVVSADGNTETQLKVAAQPVRISLPEGALIETRDETSGEWRPFLQMRQERHRFTDFSLLD